jgi:cell wall-associated NlpC family hydrolase
LTPAFRCAVDIAPVRAEPRDNAEQVTQALRNEPLVVDEHREGWVRIRTAYDYPGWVRESAVAEGEGRLPEQHSGSTLDEARRYLGAPYLWGGMTERGIDCSGLVHMSYRGVGRLVPRDADQQEGAGRRLSPEDVEPGDLITYGDTDKEVATHIAFWLGAGRILHSTERARVNGVVEEAEPEELRARRRVFLRL